jgi:hypothetical protein
VGPQTTHSDPGARPVPRHRPRSPASCGRAIAGIRRPPPGRTALPLPQVRSQLSRRATLQDSLYNLPQKPTPAPVNDNPSRSTRAIRSSNRPASNHLLDNFTSRACRPRWRAHHHTKGIHPLIIGHGHLCTPSVRGDLKVSRADASSCRTRFGVLLRQGVEGAIGEPSLPSMRSSKPYFSSIRSAVS